MENVAVKSFLNQFNEKITGVISCFDRILFKGYLPLAPGDGRAVVSTGHSHQRLQQVRATGSRSIAQTD